MRYLKPYDQSNPDAPYVDGNPGAGVEGSIVPAGALEYPQRELDNLINEAGITPSNGDLTQVAQAVRAIAGGIAPSAALVHYGPAAGGSANAIVVPTVTPDIGALSLGMLFEVVPNNTNTGAVTIAIDGGSALPLQRRDGTPLVANDIVAGVPFVAIYLGGALRIFNAVPSEIVLTTVNVINGLKIPGGTPFPFPSAGTFTLNVAAGVTFGATGIGGGGGGGGASGSGFAGSGAGQGGKFAKVGTALTATVLQIIVGAGGAGGTGSSGAAANGAAGGATSITIVSGSVQGVDGTIYTAGQTFVAATGGGFGYAGNGMVQNSFAGLGGISSGGDSNDIGDNGNYPIGPIASVYLGGRGGGGTSDNFGAAGNTSLAPGTGGNGSSLGAPGGTGRDGRVIITK